MEIILQQNFPSLGYVGDRVRVRNGYGRNYLIPRGIAIEASVRNARILNHKLEAINAKRAKLKAEAVEYGKRLESVSLEFTLKLGESGKSYGSVTSKDIESSLQKLDFTISRKQIKLTEAMKKPGEYNVSVKLHSEVSILVPVKVVAEKPKEPVVKAEGRKRGKKKDAAEDQLAAEGADTQVEGATEQVAAGSEEAPAPKKSKKTSAKKEKREASEE